MNLTGRTVAAVVTAAAVTGGLGACGVSAPQAVATCDSLRRVATVAQSVPAATYVPCIAPLPAGWRNVSTDIQRGRTQVRLLSDRADGRAVEVSYQARCDIRQAVPRTPRAIGVRTYLQLRSISPRYAGTITDVFPGGCVTYRFDFRRGPHIPLMADLEQAVRLLPRQQLRIDVRRELHLELGP